MNVHNVAMTSRPTVAIERPIQPKYSMSVI